MTSFNVRDSRGRRFDSHSGTAGAQCDFRLDLFFSFSFSFLVLPVIFKF